MNAITLTLSIGARAEIGLAPHDDLKAGDEHQVWMNSYSEPITSYVTFFAPNRQAAENLCAALEACRRTQ